jgi:YVTN family beta-propeller protein
MPAPSAGSTIAGYRIERLAGRGGMGVVYLATQLALKRPVALKLISPDLAGDPLFRERFKAESELAASIDHPNIIPVYEAGEQDGLLFISMRYVQGTDLGTLIASERRLEPGHAATIAAQVAAALDAAHRRGLVHRDVKPANVLLTADGDEHVYLTDFGLTKRVTATSGLTKTGQFLGTVDYIAPEQIGEERADARSDVYSLGCLFFHALTGRVPFERDTEVAKIYAHLNDPPPAPSKYVRGLPTELDQVIARAMAKDPADRYQSAGDLGRAALAAARGRPALAPERSVATGAAVAAGPTKRSPSRRRRHPALRVALPLALLIVIVTGAAVALLGRSDGGPSVTTIRVGGRPDSVDVNRDSVWVTDVESRRIWRFARFDEKLSDRPAPVPGVPRGVAAGRTGAWVTAEDNGKGLVFRIDREGVSTGDPIPVGGKPEGISLRTGGRVWVTSATDTVTRIDPRESANPYSRQVVKRPAGVFAGSQAVWVTSLSDDQVFCINQDSLEPGSGIPVGDGPRDIDAGFGSVWVANSRDGSVTAIDPSRMKKRKTIQLGANPWQLALGAGFVWVTIPAEDEVIRIDPESFTTAGDPIKVGDEPRGIAFYGWLWVANRGDGTISRVELATQPPNPGPPTTFTCR